MTTHADRASVLRDLLSFHPTLELTLQALGQVPAQPTYSAQLDRQAVRQALEAFSEGQISAELLERWAEAVQGADDIALDPQDRELLADALFQLSTPDLFGSMDQVVLGLMARVQSTSE